MEEVHRRAIQNNFSSLVEQTDLDSVVTLLYEKGVFSEAMIEPYRDMSKDLRTRKRQLYRDIERRGPTAFENLIDTLTETGHWNLVRALKPDTMLQPHIPTISLRNAKRPTLGPNNQAQTAPDPPHPPVPSDDTIDPTYAPTAECGLFTVVRSSKFNDGPNCYRTRTRKRGIALLITNIEFDNNMDTYRKGAEADERNLKDLFAQIGFHKIIAYKNLTYQEMKSMVDKFTQLTELEQTECVFVVIASHGYEREHTNDVDIRCKDGLLMSSFYIIEQFNHLNCPKLHNIPKVFVFQTCRGRSTDTRMPPSSMMRRPPAETDGATPMQPDRLYSDIIIANATIPGFVSHRDPQDGSWYIQAMCKVFAERAHDTHVDELFKLVDRQLQLDFSVQTSSVDRWGFNNRLYLHPGLVDDSIHGY